MDQFPHKEQVYASSHYGVNRNEIKLEKLGEVEGSLSESEPLKRSGLLDRKPTS